MARRRSAWSRPTTDSPGCRGPRTARSGRRSSRCSASFPHACRPASPRSCASARATGSRRHTAGLRAPRARYSRPSRDGGTLCGFRRHRRVADALATPGAQDITAWVDFSALAEDAADAGFTIGGFATQAHYLLETGIDRELGRLTGSAGEHGRAAHAPAAATLLLP